MKYSVYLKPFKTGSDELMIHGPFPMNAQCGDIITFNYPDGSSVDSCIQKSLRCSGCIFSDGLECSLISSVCMHLKLGVVAFVPVESLLEGL